MEQISCETVTVGRKQPGKKRYCDGECKLRVLQISGNSPEQRAQAETLRRQVLEKHAEKLYADFTAKPQRELDTLFQMSGTGSLRELIAKQISADYFYLLSLFLAEEVICESKRLAGDSEIA